MEKIVNVQTNGHQKGILKPNTQSSIIELHTDDIQDIITKVPSWIIRWGITLFFGILLMVVFISLIVRYPDTIKSTIKLSSTGSTMPVIAVSNSRITKLFIKQNAIVKQGQPLAVTEAIDDPTEIKTIISPKDGQAEFVAIVEPGALLKLNQVIFNIDPTNESFFGVLEISPASINKIKLGQKVLIDIKNYPTEEYGQLKGVISYIADQPDNRGLFTIKITLNNSGEKKIKLKTWMTGDADIVTQDLSVGGRIYKSLLKGL